MDRDGELTQRSSLSCLCSQVSSDSVNRTFTSLIICEKGNEDLVENSPNARGLPHLYNTALFIPEGWLHSQQAGRHWHWCRGVCISLQRFVKRGIPDECFSYSILMLFRPLTSGREKCISTELTLTVGGRDLMPVRLFAAAIVETFLRHFHYFESKM